MNIGIDFGHYSIKIVALDNNKIHTCGEKRIAEDMKVFDIDKLEASHWVSAFNSLCEELNLKIKKTVEYLLALLLILTGLFILLK